MIGGREPAIRAALSGLAGLTAVVLLATTPPGFDLSVPLWAWMLTGVGAVILILVSRRADDTERSFVITSATGMVVLTIFAIDASPQVPLGVWWPAWGLHAANCAHSLTGRDRLAGVGAGAATLITALLVTGAPPADLVLHAGSYLILSGMVVALADHHAATAAERADAVEAVASRTRLLSTLAQMNRLETDALGQTAVRGLLEAGYEMGTFATVDERTHTVTSVASLGFAPDVHLDRPLPMDVGLAGEAFRAGRTVVIPDYREWSGRVEQREEIAGAAGVPVFVDGRPSAVLLGARMTPGAPADEQIEVLEMLAAQAARVMLNARRFDEEQRAAARLAELDALEEDFIASVTHELRTPLTIIRGVSETLTGRREELAPAQRTVLIERLLASAQRLDGLIGTLLYVSQLEAGAVDAELEDVLTTLLVSEAIAAADPHGDARIHPDLRVSSVACDPGLIRRVLEQLLSNAINHNPPGTRIDVEVIRSLDGVRFTVRDNGVGIAPDEERHVAQRFYRGGPSTRRSSSGLGLGLSICDHLLRVHGSDLAFRSTAGDGTEASFVLHTPPDQAITRADRRSETRVSS